MVELWLTICMISNPVACKDIHAILDTNGAPPTPYVCAHAGQEQAKEWLDHNDGWKLTRMRCKAYEKASEEDA